MAERKPLIKATLFVSCLLFVGACSEAEPKAQQSEIYLVRHFQKQVANKQTGSDVELTSIGTRNAQILSAHLKDKNIQNIYSTNYKRTTQTAAPTSEQTGVKVSMYDPRDLSTFAQQLQKVTSNQLVVGHSNTTGELFGLLGCEAVSLSEKDYGDVFVVKRLHTPQGTTIAACNSYTLVTPDYNVEQLTRVSQADLPKYWQQTNTRFTIDVSASMDTDPDHNGPVESNRTRTGPLLSGQNDLVEIGFIIDVNGNTSHFEVLKSAAHERFNRQALLGAKQLVFTRPTSQNVNAGTIYTTWVFTFITN